MDTMLITGANGFFASRLKEHFKDTYKVIALSHSELDITREKDTAALITGIRPEYVVHAAAISDTGICERNPELSYDVNVKGTINMAKGCAASGAKLVFFSSDQVYNGNVESGPYGEECTAVPNTVYGRHKLEAENAVKLAMPDAVILRLTWLFSLPERNKKTNSNIVWNLVRAALKNESMILPANEYRGITYVYDILDNFDKILKLPGGTYNTGSESDLSTYDAGRAVLERMWLGHRTKELLIKDVERYKDNKRDLRINNSKLAAAGIEFTSTEAAIEKCLRDFGMLCNN